MFTANNGNKYNTQRARVILNSICLFKWDHLNTALTIKHVFSFFFSSNQQECIRACIILMSEKVMVKPKTEMSIIECKGYQLHLYNKRELRAEMCSQIS